MGLCLADLRILPIKKIKDESALNNFREYSMLSSSLLTQYFGFTEDELKALCVRYDMNYDSVSALHRIEHLSIYHKGRHLCRNLTSDGKQVVCGYFVLHNAVVVVAGDAVCCDHDKVKGAAVL